MGRRVDGETRRWGDAEMGRDGDGERRRWGETEIQLQKTVKRFSLLPIAYYLAL